ncbi:MAG: YitT family protein, partial [Phascolarctobacterium sp.]|nr:YitT family protein [Phascolarctobacterium sp.]
MKNFFNSIFYRYLMVAIGCVIMGIAFNTFYLPNNLLSGGISGVALISYYLFGLPVGIMSVILNIPLFILAYKFMDKEYIVGALFGMLTFSFCID